MLNNINSRGLSKSKKVSVSNFPGDTLKAHPDNLILHAGTNNLTKNINTLRSAKKLCQKAKRISPDTKIVFLNIIYWKNRRNTDKQRIDTNSRLIKFCNQKNDPLIYNGTIKKELLGVKKLLLNRRGNSLFAKNLVDFIEQIWNCKRKGDISIYSEDISNVPPSDVQQVLKDIRKGNVNKLVIGQLNINSLRKKIDMLSELIKGFVDIFMISETKLDNSFPKSQFFIDGCHTQFRCERNGNGGDIFLYVREDITAKVIHCDFPTSESIFIEINLHKKKRLINCSYNPHKTISAVIWMLFPKIRYGLR